MSTRDPHARSHHASSLSSAVLHVLWLYRMLCSEPSLQPGCLPPIVGWHPPAVSPLPSSLTAAARPLLSRCTLNQFQFIASTCQQVPKRVQLFSQLALGPSPQGCELSFPPFKKWSWRPHPAAKPEKASLPADESGFCPGLH